jgi:deoxyribodipyrimidine photolyase-related protein
MTNTKFIDQLASSQKAIGKPTSRKWQYVPYEQLNDALGLLGKLPPEAVGIVLCETTWKPSLRPYHKQKLLLLLTSQRHFALEQARRGVAVRYLTGSRPYNEMLGGVIAELGPLVMCRPAERELREVLAPLVTAGDLVEESHDGWLTQPDDFKDAFRGKATWRMDSFYRLVRKRYGVLLDAKGGPVGGKWSHDADNRKPWRGEPAAPTPPQFEVDSITNEVCALVRSKFASHPGEMKPQRIPATIEQVEHYWDWVMKSCLHHFGPYEDAMSTQSRQLFHTRVSSLLNLNRLLPRRVLSDVLAMDLPINSQEGLVRQVLGWREYVRHVHEVTDGFRDFTQTPPAFRETKPPVQSSDQTETAKKLPAAFWGKESGLFCLDHVVSEVLEDAHTHHINRLMILSNWATLLDADPRALTDWFWVCFDDAYDWVVEPNVLGMGTAALGTLMVTKPYVSGSAYVNKMSDYCGECAFEPKRNCPMTHLYWAFLERSRSELKSNPRLRIVMSALSKRQAEKKTLDASVFETVSRTMESGGTLTPAELDAMIARLA